MNEEDLQSLLDDIKAHKNNKVKTIDETREFVRTVSTYLILLIYIVCVGAVVAGGLYSDIDINKLKELVGFMSILVMPLITLVLGFYFGSETKR